MQLLNDSHGVPALHCHHTACPGASCFQVYHVLQKIHNLSIKISCTIPASQQPTTWPSLLDCTAGSIHTGSTSSPKPALWTHQKLVGNKSVNLGDREGIVGRAAANDPGLNCIPNLCCAASLFLYLKSCLIHAIEQTWPNLSAILDSVQNGPKIKDSG